MKQKTKLRKLKSKIEGITLVALVVTIIVLLILAAVAINYTIGNNGIFTRAENAVDRYEVASDKEKNELNEASNFIDEYIKINSKWNLGKTVLEAKELNKPFENDTIIKDDLLNDVKVPAGFKIAEDSKTKVEDGVVIEDDVGNQFVWVPAKTGDGTIVHTTLGDITITYQRTDFGKQDGIYDDFSETMPTDEESSVNFNGGYYIGRFEAGDKVSTDAKKMRASGDSTSNEVSIKKGQAPYNFITYDDSKTLAEGMSQERKYKAITKLVSSYAWDKAINLIKIKNEDYGINSQQGNYKDTTFQYIDIEENEQTKEKGSNVLVPTGQTTAVSNIYDMGGNVWERTTEFYNNSTTPISSISNRGGDYDNNSSVTPASYRDSISNMNVNVYYSFRIALFL